MIGRILHKYDPDVLDHVAMKAVPYVSIFANEWQIAEAEKQIAKIREWAKAQDAQVKAAYLKWVESTEYCIKEARKHASKQERIVELSDSIPRPEML